MYIVDGADKLGHVGVRVQARRWGGRGARGAAPARHAGEDRHRGCLWTVNQMVC